LGILATGSLLLFNYWTNTQPVWVYDESPLPDTVIELPQKNKDVISFIEASGQSLAPDYNSVVCTEFVIKVIDHFNELTHEERKAVRIITEEDLSKLLEHDSPLMKGVQTALMENNKGVEIKDLNEVRPGDFVQFWNDFQGSCYGHCGIVSEIKAGESITLYSSHPMTDGYGIQKFMWPSKVFFVRLK
jgi:hypothetical protein